MARARALELVREEWAELSLAFAAALRDSLRQHGEEFEGLTVIAALGDEAPQLLLLGQPEDHDAST